MNYDRVYKQSLLLYIILLASLNKNSRNVFNCTASNLINCNCTASNLINYNCTASNLINCNCTASNLINCKQARP